MRLKSRLRKILSHYLVESNLEGAKGKIFSQGLIKYVKTDHNIAVRSGSPLSGYIRVLANSSENANEIFQAITKQKDDLRIKSVHVMDKALEYTAKEQKNNPFSHSILIERDLGDILRSSFESSMRKQSDFFRETIMSSSSDDILPHKVAIEFSSPNIAKPFHYGHLKSTILGNFLANLNSFLGNHVTKINYIGDWGTQFGILMLGLEERGITSIDDLDEPLRFLLNIYIESNSKAMSDQKYFDKAKELFYDMEIGNNSQRLNLWHKIRELSLDELNISYKQLGIIFDEYEFESDYSDKAQREVIEILKEKCIAYETEDGAVFAKIERNYRPLEIPICKSDGSSLYISRDIAAALNRKSRLNFDKMLYVVGGDQAGHFQALKDILYKLDLKWADSLKQVTIGKVAGMSTRSGNFVLLSELIRELKTKFASITRETITSKVDSLDEVEEVAKHLALTALFVFDASNKRTVSYKFDWDNLLSRGQSSGINVQTAYARLCSLNERASRVQLGSVEFGVDEVEGDAVNCIEAHGLLCQLNELDTNLLSSYWDNDPKYLVWHALKLSVAANRARRSERLRVLGDNVEERAARTRLALFELARGQLKLIIELLGLKALEKV